MKFNRIYANGCSFTGAGGLNFKHIRNRYKEILDIDLSDDYIQYAYPNIVAKTLNVDIINDAISGGSVNRLIRKTYQYVYDNQHTVSSNLFILEIPPMWRDEIYSNQLDRLMNTTWGSIKFPGNDLTDVAAGFDISDMQKIHKELQSYFYNFVNTDFEYKKSMNNMLGLIFFLKHKNIDVILIDNSFFENFLYKNSLEHNFNFVHFENLKMEDWFIQNKLRIDDELKIKIDSHAGLDGNKQIADIILKYLYTKKFIN
jgi:hypothetical protein